MAIDLLLETPQSYAKRLAGYISSPTKIEALTRMEFGRAPDLHVIANMRYAVEQEAKPARRPCKESAERDGDDYAMPSLLRRAAPPPKPRVTAHIDFDPRPTEPPTNPFLQTWRLTMAVIESVATDFGLCAAHVLGASRRREYIWARAVAIRLLNEQGLSAAGIGRKLHRDHSTILHALKHFDAYARQCETVSGSYRRHALLALEARREAPE